MLQLVREVFKNPQDKTNLFLLFANQVSKKHTHTHNMQTKPVTFTSLVSFPQILHEHQTSKLTMNGTDQNFVHQYFGGLNETQGS